MTLTAARQLGDRLTMQGVPEATLTTAIEVLDRSGKGVVPPIRGGSTT